jgi:hypothetical protein
MVRWGFRAVAMAALVLAWVACGGDDGGTGARDVQAGDTATDVTGDPGAAPDTACVPACTGKACGDDGCGGSCGECTGVDNECVDGQCVAMCAPACTGKQCGDDGCGGSCGVCYDAQGAVDASLCKADGTCVDETCVPACTGKACGDDGCGGSCGGCFDYQQCTDGQCVGDPPCGTTGIVAALQSTTLEDAGGGNKVFVHREYNATSSPIDVFGIEDYPFAPYNGPTAPGVYDLAGQNYEDCGLCVVGSTGCTDSACDKRFFMKSGTLEIIEYGGAGGKFKAVLNGVLEEVTIDANTFHSTPVPGGQTWCFTDHVIDETIVAPAQLGESIGDFTLQNCYGEPLQFSSLASSRAIWLTVVAGWCPSCATWLPQVAAKVKELKAANKRVTQITILGEDAYSQMPTEAYCVGYAEDHDLDPADVYIDWQYDTTFSHIDPYLSADGSFAIPWDVLVKGNGFVYTWHSQLASPDLDTVLTQLLNSN